MNASAPIFDIQHDTATGHFAVTVEGHYCELVYALKGSVMTIQHTGVPRPVGGRGIAAQLVRAALEAARQRGWQVVPACSYAAVYVARHPEYADLIA